MPRKQDKQKRGDWKGFLLEDPGFLKELVEAVIQQILEAEMEETLQAAKGERTAARLGYRAGYYRRTWVCRVGKLELRVPQDREGRFSTRLFERYQRSERALVQAPLRRLRRHHFGDASLFLQKLLDTTLGDSLAPDIDSRGTACLEPTIGVGRAPQRSPW